VFAPKTVTVAATALLFAIASCSQQPDPEPVATSLAAGMTSGDFSSVPLAELSPSAVTEEFGEIIDGLGDVSPSVTVVEVTEDDADDAIRHVTLDVSWQLPGDDVWSYPTTTRMLLTEDDWQVEWAPDVLHPDLTEGDRLGLQRTTADRADVLGADDAVLVTERPVLNIGIDKTRVDDDETLAASAGELADIVGIDAEGFADRVESAGERAFVVAITLREEDATDVLDDIEAVDGALAQPDTLHLAPTREFARPILGTAGEATEEIVEESEGRVEPGDLTGLSGLQRSYDEALAGTPGLAVELVPEEGERAVLYEREPVAGQPVTLTLDVDLQRHAEDILGEVGPASALVALEASTGNVLVAASGPGSEGYSTATLGQYAPGSTFKIATSLALLRAGLSPKTTMSCPATLTVDGREFSNYSDYPSSGLGDISLRTAVANSCNTAFMGQRDVVTQAELAAAAASLGLGLDFAVGMSSFGGSVPDAADGATEHAASMIGQGQVLASPLAMATVAASVAAGETVTPRLVVDTGSLGDDGGDADSDGGDGGDAASAPDTPLTTAEAETLAELMRAVVTEGSASFLRDIPGDPVGAKTGTAEFGSESPPDTHGWMIAIQGDLAVAVFVEEGDSGASAAGPLLADFLRAAS
jgi:cell division protein FtsI/penicillin-binding protein 2